MSNQRSRERRHTGARTRLSAMNSAVARSSSSSRAPGRRRDSGRRARPIASACGSAGAPRSCTRRAWLPPAPLPPPATAAYRASASAPAAGPSLPGTGVDRTPDDSPATGTAGGRRGAGAMAFGAATSASTNMPMRCASHSTSRRSVRLVGRPIACIARTSSPKASASSGCGGSWGWGAFASGAAGVSVAMPIG